MPRVVHKTRKPARQSLDVMKRVPFAFENLAPPTDPRREPAIVSRELRALANNLRPDEDRPRPKVIALCETIGHRLPLLDHFALWRDLRPAGRANLALYVRADLDVEVEWRDLRVSWPRTKAPGPHPPRSIMVAAVEDWLVIVGHAPPKVRGAAEARSEWLDAMVRLMRQGGGPILALTDPNGLGADLARQTRAVHGGTSTDAVHAVDAVLDAVRTPHAVNGTPMLTDHGCALLGRARRTSTTSSKRFVRE